MAPRPHFSRLDRYPVAPYRFVRIGIQDVPNGLAGRAMNVIPIQDTCGNIAKRVVTVVRMEKGPRILSVALAGRIGHGPCNWTRPTPSHPFCEANSAEERISDSMLRPMVKKFKTKAHQYSQHLMYKCCSFWHSICACNWDSHYTRHGFVPNIFCTDHLGRNTGVLF